MQLKRVCAILLTLVLAISLVACGKGGQGGSEPTETVPLTDEQILAQRREQVVAKMRQMQFIIWRSDTDFRYTKHNSSAGVENDPASSVVDIVKGRLYRGIPYTHGSGSFEAFMGFAVSQDEKGIYTLSGLSEEILSGDNTSKSVYTPRVGNDCADSIFWAWAQISTSISFRMTTYMTETYGCIKVGDYDCDPEKLLETAEVCQQNGEQKMYEAYAKLQPGDAVVYSVSSGHAMMVSEVNVVRKEDGTINKLKSHIKIVDQTSGNIVNEKYYYDETLKENVYYCGNIDAVFTFHALFEKGYLPVTCKELIDPSPIEVATVQAPEKTFSLENMFEGVIKCNYRISHVTISITDAQGKTVQQSTCFGVDSEMYYLDLARFLQPKEQSVLRGILNLDALEAGTYRCTYTCQVATGEMFEVASFTFQK